MQQNDATTLICAESDEIKDHRIKSQLDTFVEEKKYESRLLYLLAKTYLMVQNRPAAAGCLRSATRNFKSIFFILEF